MHLRPTTAEIGLDRIPPDHKLRNSTEHHRVCGIKRNMRIKIVAVKDLDPPLMQCLDGWCIGHIVLPYDFCENDRLDWPQLSIFSAAIKASCGISTRPNCRIRFLPSFCLSSSLRLREISPP